MLIRSDSPQATAQVGAALGRALDALTQPDPVTIGLNGDLGAGKTTLVAGLLHALGASGPIRSPTYTLIEPYELAGRHLYHLDLYRLASADELTPLALRDLLEPRAVLLVEWAERGAGVLPPVDLALTLQYEANAQARCIQIIANSLIGKDLQATLQKLTHEGLVSSSYY
jgi:tRNA threonylcarbamoyladenosine biosynthesis protein TsaE